MIGLGSSITDTAEFNRRAAAALKGVSFGENNRTEGVVREFEYQLGKGAVSVKMQQAVYNIVHRYRNQISDALVTEYAALRAKGAD